MSEQDLQRIEKAEKLNPIDWYVASTLAKEADTPEAEKRLKSISSALYHREEAMAGLL